MEHLSDQVVYTTGRIAKRWPPFGLDVVSSGDGTYTFTERGSSLWAPLFGGGFVFVAVAIGMHVTLPPAPALVWPLLAVGLAALLGALVLATGSRVLKVETKAGRAHLQQRRWGVEREVCRADHVRIATCRVDLKVGRSVRPPWKGFMAVVWLTPHLVFPIAAGRTREDVERYVQGLPPELRTYWTGEGPAILANS